MGKNKFIPKFRRNPIVVFHNEKKLLETNYDNISCSITRHGLTCIGKFRPDEDSELYSVRIKYDYKSPPKVRVLSPKITPSAKYHTYSNGDLCLYYPKEQPWNYSSHLYDTIMPWVAEWLVFYELYLVLGKWLGPEQTHGKFKQQDKSKNVD